MKQDNTFKRKVLKTFLELKQEKQTKAPPIIPMYIERLFLGYLRAVTINSLENNDEIKRLAKWRKQSEFWFPAQFKVTVAGTKLWTKERLLDAKDRFLFMIETPSGEPIGHVGLFRFDFQKKACEIDNVIRGETYLPGIMTHAINTLVVWAKKYLGVKKIYLEVFSDNEKAIKLYERCGFEEIKRVPLKKIETKKVISWIEAPEQKKVSRYNVYMQLKQSRK